MRFEAGAAVAIGLLLPVLETARRGFAEWGVHFTTMFEDYLGGALLLAGAWAAYRGLRWAAPFLLAAWGAVTGMMTVSLVSQIEDSIRATDLEEYNAVVLVVKFVLFGICTAALVSAFAAVTRREA